MTDAMCRICGIELIEGLNWYSSHKKNCNRICKECDNKRSADWYNSNLEHARNIQKDYRIEHSSEINTQKRKHYKENRPEVRAYQNEQRMKLRKEVITHYSKGAMLCEDPYHIHAQPFGNIYALTIDHVMGGGNKHREIVGWGDHFYRRLRNEGYPEGYQVLCMNCQWIKVREDNSKYLKSGAAERNRKSNKKLKTSVVMYYSNELGDCSNCGCIDIRCLTIDHINGRGNKHFKSLGLKGGADFYRWLRDNNFPPGYQVLCWNCQYIKRAKYHEWGRA